MYAGEIVEEAPAEKLFADARHPYTQGLLRSIPRADQVRGRLPTLPGSPPDMTALPSGCRFRDRCPQAQARCETHPVLLPVASSHTARCWVAQDAADADASLRELSHGD
jgi:oligopeptide/dipeptide ABC transporter ATP-binding protein